MNSKKWIKIFSILTFSTIVLVGLTNYIIDPFQQYRASSFYPISYSNERFQNPGLSKNLNYDSIILGTSMTENFLLNEVENYLGFKKTLKLSISGGSAYEQRITLETALNKKSLKNVIWGIDTFVFIGDTDRIRFGKGSFPLYLYDTNFFNDYKYLLSMSTIEESIVAISEPFSNNKLENYDYNRMYEWQNDKDFTIKNVKDKWFDRANYINYEHDKHTFEYMKKSFDDNFLAIFEKNKDINFKIFFPPYSILTFKAFEDRGLIDEILDFKKYLFIALLKYENIEIYDFQNEKIITHNLTYYKDLSHYHQKINTWILKNMKDDKYLINDENFNEKINLLKKDIKNYKVIYEKD